METAITRNPDEYMYDILWGVSDSRIVRDEGGVEETETNEEKEKREEERVKREKEEKEKREKEESEKRERRRGRGRKERINKCKNMETSEIRK